MLVRAPLVAVTLHTGESVDLESLHQDRPLALVFLRHFGCLFCREQLSQLRPYADENIVFVSMSKVQEAAEFRDKMEIQSTFVSDPLKTLYEQFGLKRGSFAQMFSTTTFKRGFQATVSGHLSGVPVGDPWMLAGTFVIGTDGEILFSHFSRDASDNLPGETIVNALRAASNGSEKVQASSSPA